MKTASASIVVNTLNRGACLRKLLESLRWQKFRGEFEVIVVNGPSTDDTGDVLVRWAPHIRVGECPIANVSISRNIGVCMARGDVIAFIDDDAIPEPEWLSRLAEAYEDPEVGAAGGPVYDHTGYTFQYRYCLMDRFGNVDHSPSQPTPQFCFPQSLKFPHLLGCNSSYRRSALLEIGGFDEEFEYYLEETDVCLRIVDAGHVIAQVPHAYVHHEFAPNGIRGENRVARDRYSIIKNKIYFMLKHGRLLFPEDRIRREQDEFIQKQKDEIEWTAQENLLTPREVGVFYGDLERAVETGTRRGYEGVKAGALIDHAKLTQHAGEFLPFKTIPDGACKSVVFVSRTFPADPSGAAAPYTREYTESLAAKGDIVHVITQSSDADRVEFVNGVWLHRMRPRAFKRTHDATVRAIAPDIWNWSRTALAEARRIAGHRAIDVVEAPLREAEGAAFLLEGAWPLVTSLHAFSGGRAAAGFVPALEHELLRRSEVLRFTDMETARRAGKEHALSLEDRIIILPETPPYERLYKLTAPGHSARNTVAESSMAVILMTHRFDPCILNEFRRLQEGLGPNDRAFILSDGTEPTPDAFVSVTHSYNVADVLRRAARTIGNRVYHNVHLPWLDFFASHPGFDYYWFVEYDVKFSGHWRDFFEAFRELDHDLLCTHLRPYSHEPEWAWWREVEAPDPGMVEERRVRGFMPITRLSRQGLAAFGTAVQKGLNGFYEGTLPTFLINFGLKVADMGGDGPFVPPGFRNRFYTSESDSSGALWGTGTFRFRPPIRIPGIMPGRLYHPVKPEQRLLDSIGGGSTSTCEALEAVLSEMRSSRAGNLGKTSGEMESLLAELTGLSVLDLKNVLDGLDSSGIEQPVVVPLQRWLQLPDPLIIRNNAGNFA